MATAVKRACDACHRRKVKCDGINPCRNCSSAQLSCTYNAIPQKKGPKGSRAKVISELRETQRQTSLSAKAQNRFNGVNCPQTPPSLAPTPGLLTGETVKECLDFFFTNMYPTMPILHRQRLEQQSFYMDQNIDTYCLLSSLCAFMMLQPGMGLPTGDPYSIDNVPGANIVSGTLLLEETTRVRKGYDHLDSPTLNTLCTSYFLFACYHGIELHEKAWYHLREATTLAHMIGMNKEETYMQYDNVEASRRRRLYWLLFVTERSYALQRQRPLTLQASINVPALTDDPSDPLAHQLNSFFLLVNLFRPFDDHFIGLWNKTRGELSQSYVTALQKQLGEMLPAYMNCGDAADLRNSQQWLKSKAWECSNVANGVTSSGGENGGISFQFNVDDLMSMASSFSAQGMGLSGVGLIGKLYEIASSLTDVLSLQPASRDPFTVGPREQLDHILNLLTVLRNGGQIGHRFVPLLFTKMQDVLPRLASPMLQSAPENTNMCTVDIFDGLGNAGMAQPPVQMDEYEKKFSLQDMNNDTASSSGGPPSNNDMNSPFASSPSILSPGMEFPAGMKNEFPPNAMQNEFHPVGDVVGSAPHGAVHHNSSSTHHASNSLQQQQQQQQQQAQHQHHAMPGFHQNVPTGASHGLSPELGQNSGMPMGSQTVGRASSVQHSMPYGMTNGSLGHDVNGTMMGRPQPQRTASFAMPTHAVRTVSDFHALQRSNPDMTAMHNYGMNNMGPELNFNSLR